MMDNRKQFAIKFADVLSKHLIKKYKKGPSGYFIADQFNLRASGTSTITSETARKWIKGLAVPEIDRFKVLMDWLEFNPSDLFSLKVNAEKNNEMNKLIEALEIKLNEINEALQKFKT